MEEGLNSETAVAPTRKKITCWFAYVFDHNMPVDIVKNVWMKVNFK